MGENAPQEYIFHHHFPLFMDLFAGGQGRPRKGQAPDAQFCGLPEIKGCRHSSFSCYFYPFLILILVMVMCETFTHTHNIHIFFIYDLSGLSYSFFALS